MYFVQRNNHSPNNMKPIYGTIASLNCGTIQYGGKLYLVDEEDKAKIIAHRFNFKFQSAEDDYPSYPYNKKRVSYLNFITSLNEDQVFEFRNGDKFDLRKDNIKKCHHYHEQVMQQYPTATVFSDGHPSIGGCDAGVLKNPIWKIIEDEKEYLLMYCEPTTLVKLCPKSYQIILEFEESMAAYQGQKITWYMGNNGYVYGKISKPTNSLMMHQVITNHYGHGKGTGGLSVDHIDQNKINNSFENLRIATRDEQEQNTTGIKPNTKQARRKTARPLPDGIKQEDMLQYVIYYYVNKKREFFTVESPKLDREWASSKSMKVSIFDKLAAANQVARDLANDIYPAKKVSELPQYVTYRKDKGVNVGLIFDKKQKEGERKSVRITLPKNEEYDLDEQIDILRDAVQAKYGITI